jgi:4-hydroxyphenylacetate 3-monooxygenase
MTTTGVRSGQLLTGEAYLESLRDAREVYLDGERVHDVTTHPAFAKSARTVARLYDARHDPEHRDTLVGTDRDGIVTHEFFRPAYTVEDLRRGAEAVKLWSQMSYGWMGRTPDYKAAFMATLGADPSFYAPFEETGHKWYREYATKGLFLNHVLTTRRSTATRRCTRSKTSTSTRSARPTRASSSAARRCSRPVRR